MRVLFYCIYLIEQRLRFPNSEFISSHFELSPDFNAISRLIQQCIFQLSVHHQSGSTMKTPFFFTIPVKRKYGKYCDFNSAADDCCDETSDRKNEWLNEVLWPIDIYSHLMRIWRSVLKILRFIHKKLTINDHIKRQYIDLTQMYNK